jgi:hypothetical protein
MNLRLDTRQQTLLNVIQNRVMLNDIQILNLSDELLVRVLARTAHHGVRHLLRLHLLGNLTGSYDVLVFGDTARVWKPTIVATEKEDINELETKDAEEVPADAGHPTRIHLPGLNTSLEHALELDSDGER